MYILSDKNSVRRSARKETPKTKTPAKKSWANVLKQGLAAKGVPENKAARVLDVVSKGRKARATRKKNAEPDVLPEFDEVSYTKYYLTLDYFLFTFRP